MSRYFSTRTAFSLLAALIVTIILVAPSPRSHAQSRDAVLECKGGLLVWSQPSGSRFLVFFKGPGKYRSLDVEANFGRKVLFGVQGRAKSQIHADKKTGSVRCRYH